MLAGLLWVGPVSAAAPVEVARVVADNCTTCGKRVFFRETCAKCVLAKLDAKLAHACVDCETKIRLGTRCTTCAAKHWKARFDQTKARLLELGDGLGADLGGRLKAGLWRLDVTANDAESEDAPQAPDEGPPPTPEERAAALARAEARAIAAAETSWIARAKAFAKLPDSAALAGLTERLDLGGRAVVALGAALEVADSVETTKAKLAAAGIQRALDLPVRTDAGTESLGDLASAQLLAALPELAGTDLAKDPAAVLAAVIVMDPLAFLMDFQLVPSPGEPQSIMAALAERGDQDPAFALATVTLIEAVADLKRGQNVTRALRDISRALDILVPPKEPPPASDQ